MRAVLVTGASTGIGEACARRLDAHGLHVLAGVRRDEDGERLRRDSDRLTPLRLDVTEADDIEAAGRLVETTVGDRGLHGLVNNAGIGLSGPLELVSTDDLRHQFEVNVFGLAAVTRRLLPLLRRGRGRVVNMSSISGRTAAPFLGPYAMSKFAVEAFSDALRREVHPWGIEVSCVEPGAIATPIWDKAIHAARRRWSAWPPEARALYGREMEALMSQAADLGRAAIGPDAVARAVEHALTARRPKTRYVIGRGARLQALAVRVLPDRWRDALIRRALRGGE